MSRHLRAVPTQPAPSFRWLIAGTPTTEPYPCMCRGARPCGTRCTCRGRTDRLDLMPTICCARRAAEAAARRAGDPEGEQ